MFSRAGLELTKVNGVRYLLNCEKNVDWLDK